MLKNWIKKIFSDIHSAIISIIVASLFVGTGSIYLFYKNLWLLLKTTLQSQTPLWATIALAVLYCLYIYLKFENLNFSFSQKNKFCNYLFDNHSGIYLHKKTKKPFCPSCLSSGIEFPLQVYEHGWLCNCTNCNKFFPNPDYKEPEPPQYKGRNAMTGY